MGILYIEDANFPTKIYGPYDYWIYGEAKDS